MKHPCRWSLTLLLFFLLTGCMVKVKPISLIEIEPPIKIKVGH